MTPWILTVALAMGAQTPEPEAPVETAPVDSAPAEVAPVDSAPAEVAPVDSAPVETAPVEAAPVAEAKPFELGHTEGVLSLAAGLALGLTSMTAFSVGFEAERQLRAGEVRGDAADEALTQRTIAACVAWPAAVLAVVGVSGGAYLLAATEDVDATVAGSGR